MKLLLKYPGIVICSFLVAAAFGVYSQVLRHDFVNYDDPIYVTKNRHVQAGLTRESVTWAFTDIKNSNWHPLTWMSHMLDWQLYGKDPKGHHRTSLLIHILSALLLFAALSRMTGAVWRSGFVAAMFALHPLHVESVAWVAERKDVLSGLFWMLTLLLYAQYARRPGVVWYCLVFLSFALGLLAKPMMVSLPLVLLLLDYWPLRRLDVPKRVPALVLEKLPLLALSCASCVVTIMAQRAGGAVPPSEVIPPGIRVGNAAVSYVAYIWKCVWPTNMAVYYPHPGHTLSQGLAALAALGLLAVTAASVACAWKRQYVLVGWLWYLITLVPVIGLVQVGGQAMADRYTYLTLTGLFIAAAWGVSDLIAPRRPAQTVSVVPGVRKSNKKKFVPRDVPAAPAPPNAVAAALAAVVLIAAAFGAHKQAGYWSDSIALFDHAAKVTTSNALAYLNLANAQLAKEDYSAALANYERSLDIKPDVPKTLNNSGNALGALGRQDEAVERYRQALELEPEFAEAHANLGIALVNLRRFDEAITEFNKALGINPNIVEAHVNLGVALGAKGLLDSAMEEFSKAVEIDPNSVDAHSNLAMGYYNKRDYGRAWEEVHACRGLGAEINPEFIKALSQALPDPQQAGPATER
ncbi:MAG: tetratricopeptide repeat protein [Armatimonadota bacterium]|nr:tetratricopeptide repeat protein [Armatimonadota bacterium]